MEDSIEYQYFIDKNCPYKLVFSISFNASPAEFFNLLGTNGKSNLDNMALAINISN